MMAANDLAVISVLADMGNGEVKDSKIDLPKGQWFRCSIFGTRPDRPLGCRMAF